MFVPVTQIYVASQTLRELVVVDPPSVLSTVLGVGTGMLFLLVGFAALIFARMRLKRSLPVLMWLLPVIAGSPFLILGIGLAAGNTRITASADTGTLSVRKTILSIPAGSQEYPISEVRAVRVGVGDVCRFLYVSLVDGRSETLLGCTDRTGYGEVAGSINEFLEANRR